ncbi:aminoglycoside phosphotransferase family protein [Kribbella sp. VKM Ac-2566]|uniref:phosphotransferase n=1 Tax=Kribbella sp. VKM Ac-2566 TaxID=2512218 RepID=UPI0010DFC8E9|nr:aminoglycoside phosphotransferase family protein [Kribbella sp. VKM Ac-2566]TDW86526.1 phosphotransferase family enzyme [Kribbella sp. VKM Ac-2566]
MSHRLEFRLSENPWAPTAVIEEVNAHTGSGLVLTGLADQVGGSSSAAFVAWADGRESALTRTRTPLAVMLQTASVLNELRGRGLPVPQHQLVLELSDGYVAVVQERLPGRHVGELNSTTAAAFVAMNDRFAGVLRDHPEVPRPRAFPASVSTFENTVGRHGERGRRLLGRLLEIDGGRLVRMQGDDLVHTDYTPGNVLFDDAGNVSGVVDWNGGAVRGDRYYALLGLHWGSIGRKTVGSEEMKQVEEKLAHLSPETRRSYEAHWMVDQVHESILKGFSPERVEADMTRAENTLG